MCFMDRAKGRRRRRSRKITTKPLNLWIVLRDQVWHFRKSISLITFSFWRYFEFVSSKLLHLSPHLQSVARSLAHSLFLDYEDDGTGVVCRPAGSHGDWVSEWMSGWESICGYRSSFIATDITDLQRTGLRPIEIRFTYYHTYISLVPNCYEWSRQSTYNVVAQAFLSFSVGSKWQNANPLYLFWAFDL